MGSFSGGGGAEINKICYNGNDCSKSGVPGFLQKWGKQSSLTIPGLFSFLKDSISSQFLHKKQKMHFFFSKKRQSGNIEKMRNQFL